MRLRDKRLMCAGMNSLASCINTLASGGRENNHNSLQMHPTRLLPLCCSTNSSYDRWWEGRKLWGGVVNRTRDIVRQVGHRGRHRAAEAT